jgi:dihydroflavonol-4-reductase
LVTGAFGFSGSHLVKLLLENNEQVVMTDHPGVIDSDQKRRCFSSYGLDLNSPGLEIVGADLVDPKSLAELFTRPITHIFHTASLYDYSASLERLRQINVEGTKNLLEAASSAPLQRFFHWSTCGVFGKPYPAKYRKKANLPFTESSSSPKNASEGQLQPEGTHLVNAYSVSKWEQEQLVWKWARDKKQAVTVIRPAPIYGPGSDYGHNGIIIAIAQGLVPAIPADARSAVTTSVHVEDVARFAYFAAHSEKTIGEDYNVVDNSIISYSEFLHYIALLVGRRMFDIPLVPLWLIRPFAIAVAHVWTWLERHLGIPRVRILEIQSATYIGSSYWISNQKTLQTGFEYRYPNVREGLKETIAWLRVIGWFS